MASSAFDKLQRASFDGIEFPVESVDVSGSIRDHIHEYPHADGGAPEKMGRRLYIVKMVANFQNTFKGYPDLWPTNLGKLRLMFENQLTSDLVIPTVGTIQAYCRNWSQLMEAKIRSGEKATFEFVEDQETKELTADLIRVGEPANFSSAGDDFLASKALFDFRDDKRAISIFDAISNLVNFVTAFKDQTEAGLALLDAKFMAVMNLLSQFDHTEAMLNPLNEPGIQVAMRLWAAAQKASEDLASKKTPIQIYVVPITSAMSSICAAIYGDTERVTELMQLNAVVNVMSIPAGTLIRFYPTPEQTLGAALGG